MQEAEATGNKRLKAVVMQAQAELYFRRGDWQEAERLFQAAIQASINTNGIQAQWPSMGTSWR